MMLKKFILILFGLCLIMNYSCEKNSNPVASNDEDTTYVIDRKPNIYIYPTQKINLTIEIDFPYGGSVIESIPFYDEIWNINVDPSGLINNQYNFLYYECKVPDRFQRNYGWDVEGDQLENFFRNNLSETGFIETEIEDFIEYWIPRLESSDDYLIYPQFCADIDPFIELQFSNEPESLLRLLYVIETKQINDEIELLEPVIPEFVRKGFTVTEWGVILKTKG